ncbi:hypothetical protein HMPREF0496_1744 [Lentilactobacillus hilgardii ATCC 27305]|nr:hypothetical protein HMPREF0496_1744 [Lentilactobacillus hilgardii ATCC 27305]
MNLRNSVRDGVAQKYSSFVLATQERGYLFFIKRLEYVLA